MSSTAHRHNTNNLRVIKTVDCTSTLNLALRNGNLTIIRKTKRNPKLYSSTLLLRNYGDGEVIEVESRVIHRRRGIQEFPESEWECVHSYERYHRNRRANKAWAAYVLPLLPNVGERFFIEDLIEDILIQTFWSTPISAEDGEAVWNGKDLELDQSYYKQHHIVG